MNFAKLWWAMMAKDIALIMAREGLDLPRSPHLLGPPGARPLTRHVVVARRGSRRRLDLDQVDDLEPARTQRPHAVAMRDVKLDAILVRSLQPTHPELAGQQSLGGRSFGE
jgi:hypothetical protein